MHAYTDISAYAGFSALASVNAVCINIDVAGVPAVAVA
jgi:hypothetical protein